MMRRSKDSIKIDQIIRELDNLIFAWREYINRAIFYNAEMKRFFASVVIGLSLSVIVGSLIWWIKSSVYAQSEVLRESVSGPFSGALRWIMSGGMISIFIGFARAKYCIFKRWFDFLVSGLSLAILSPLFLIIAVLIKIDSEGPVFFRQDRVGHQGRIFKMWKFRTMRNNAELETGPVWAEDEDPRITRIGRFLRNAHLDELPQLINVFRGHMSLIGPRPERPEFVNMIHQHIPEFHHRLGIKPGITGLAQVRYRYGASIKDAARKLKYDLLYIKRMCWVFDFQIIIWTMMRVLTGEGAR